jgi:hypothetical protein
MHSASGEEKSLKLVEDFNSELMDALDSLGGKKVNALLDTYRFWSSKHLQRAVDGFAFLRLEDGWMAQSFSSDLRLR